MSTLKIAPQPHLRIPPFGKNDKVPTLRARTSLIHKLCLIILFSIPEQIKIRGKRNHEPDDGAGYRPPLLYYTFEADYSMPRDIVNRSANKSPSYPLREQVTSVVHHQRGFGIHISLQRMAV